MPGSNPIELQAEFNAYRQRSTRPGGGSIEPVKSPIAALRKRDFAYYSDRPFERFTRLLFGAALVVTILIGWFNRNDGELTPKTGVGYWLGILGTAAMLLLLIYPLRKRIRSMKILGTVAFWFRFHMILGLVGPTLVLLHSNFQLGSINSNVALFAMLIVATSGLIGRYLYGKVHRGLYGRKAAVSEILADADELKYIIGDGLPAADRAISELNSFTNFIMAPRKSVFTNLWSLAALGVRTRIARARLVAEAQKLIATEGKLRGWPRRTQRQRLAAVVAFIRLHFAAVKKAAAFAFYERLFALWHVLHLPLFILMVFATIVHVVAVHHY